MNRNTAFKRNTDLSSRSLKRIIHILLLPLYFLCQADCMTHLLCMDLYEVVGGCDDNILWRELTHIYCEQEKVSNDLDLPCRM